MDDSSDQGSWSDEDEFYVNTMDKNQIPVAETYPPVETG